MQKDKTDTKYRLKFFTPYGEPINCMYPECNSKTVKLIAIALGACILATSEDGDVKKITSRGAEVDTFPWELLEY